MLSDVESVVWSSPVGDVTFGVVDPFEPGVAEAISHLLFRSIADARSEVGGHLPTWLVRDIERNYLVPEKVQTLWAPAGHRFAARLDGTVVGTLHVAKRHGIILTADREHNVVPASEHPGLKPERHHQVVNISVLHELRHLGLAHRMFDAITTSFRDLFDGDGLWVRADPPWHAWLVRLGFVHDPAFDVFLPPSVERTADLPHAAFNLLHACACEGAHRGARASSMEREKLQYLSFTRPFVAAKVRATPVASGRTIDEQLAEATRTGRRAVVRGACTGPSVPASDLSVSTLSLDRILRTCDDDVTVEAGVTWRTLLSALPRGRLPPVVPGHVDATVGGSLSTGGIGKGSAGRGLAIDHVRELVVVTRDGRRLTCSRDRDARLFEAVLGGHGLFGAIVEATLWLQSRRAWLTLERTPMAGGAIAGALAVDAYHAFGVWTGGHFLVVTARESERETSTPLESFVMTRPRPTVAMAQVFFDARGLVAFVGELSSSRELDGLAEEGGAVTIHPIRCSAERRSLLFPRIDADVAYAFTVAAPRDADAILARATKHGGLVAPRWAPGRGATPDRRAR